MPHWHPAAEYVTVISGEFHVGMGDKFDESSMQTLPAGSLAAVPAHHNHYAMTKGETVVQVNSTGHSSSSMSIPADDPSKTQATPAAKKKSATKEEIGLWNCVPGCAAAHPFLQLDRRA